VLSRMKRRSLICELPTGRAELSSSLPSAHVSDSGLNDASDSASVIAPIVQANGNNLTATFTSISTCSPPVDLHREENVTFRCGNIYDARTGFFTFPS